MSTPIITPDPQVQTVPTPAGTPPVAPVQPRDEQGRFAAPPSQAQPPAPVQPAPAPAAPPPAPAPYAVEDLGNGRLRVKFADLPESYEGTQAEILPKVAEALYNTKKWAQTQRQAPPQPAPAPVVPNPAPQVFANVEEEQTAKYVADLQARYLGFPDAETMKREMGFIQQTTESSATRDLSIQFMASNPTFNPTPENSEKLATILANLVESDAAWARLPVQQQLSLMGAAHAMALQNNVYTAAPAQAPVQATSPNPPPPIPTGKAPQDTYAGVPPELIPTVNDTQAVILDKIAKLKERGLWQ